MTETELDTALEELDRLINDPEVRMDPDRVWALLAQVSTRDESRPVPAAAPSPAG